MRDNINRKCPIYPGTFPLIIGSTGPTGPSGLDGLDGIDGPTGPTGPEKISQAYLVSYNNNYPEGGLEVVENERLPIEREETDIAQGIISVDNIANVYELVNLSKRSIYLDIPDLENINSNSYFVNAPVNIIVEYLGR